MRGVATSLLYYSLGTVSKSYFAYKLSVFEAISDSFIFIYIYIHTYRYIYIYVYIHNNKINIFVVVVKD